MITEKVIKVAAGSYHSVALTVTGQIFTWGYNGKYQLGRQPPPQVIFIELNLKNFKLFNFNYY